MKKLLSIPVIIMLVMLSVTCPADAGSDLNYPPRSGAEVAAIFAAPDIQPFTEADGDQEMLDSIWVFYTDGTFEQSADLDDSVLLFSTGTYEFVGDADFIYGDSGADNGRIIIRREKKLSSQGMQDYASEHTFDLGTLGFTQLYAPNPDRRIIAVFYGNDKQPYVEKDGDQEALDTWWIYYSDGTFEQFAVLEDGPEDEVVLFSEGSYQLREDSSFVWEKTGETGDCITIQRTKKFSADGLAPYESSHEYSLSTLGYVRIVAIDP